MNNQDRYDYRHPVFYSRKHPLYATNLNDDVRLALVANLDSSTVPF